MFKNKILLITGGTGSFGNAVLDKFLDSDLKEIRIFSRDEKKQDDMRHIYQAKFPELSEKIKFYIGDVRDRETIISAMNGVDYVFHAAALKQVPSCEFFPLEAVKTNVIGTDNVLSVAIKEGVKEEEIYLIDWEYGGYGDPGFDLGSYICGGEHTISEIDNILFTYYRRKPTSRQNRHFYAYIALTGWFYLHWTMLKESKGQPVGAHKDLWYRYANEFSILALKMYEEK